jgi:hypothetical protein
LPSLPRLQPSGFYSALPSTSDRRPSAHADAGSSAETLMLPEDQELPSIAHRHTDMRLVVMLLTVVLAGCGSPHSSAGEAASRFTPAPHGGPVGQVETQKLASCVESYSPRAVSGRGFAFDGTVVHVGEGTTDRPGSGHLGYAGVTFAINEWFIGGGGTSMTVDMEPPSAGQRTEEIPPSYDVGTRLLVSGESRWGGRGLEDALAWGCGFTRSYDAETARDWLHATN